MLGKEVVVLRYGHRVVRDERVTSHCCLVARAFGADRIVVEGRDEAIEKSVCGVAGRWGGDFKIGFTDSWKKTVNEYRKKGFVVVHLTMYGLPLHEISAKISKEKKILVIIGSQKVVREVYGISDYNVAIGLTPHSEIAALAVFLHDLFRGEELKIKFPGAETEIIPSAHGKKVIRVGTYKPF